MHVKEIESAGLKRKYQVTVPASDIAEQMEVKLKEAGKNVKIPGFRPGFVPMKILQQRFGTQVQADVIQTVVRTSTGKVITEKKIRPALAPEVSVDEYGEGQDLLYTVSVETFPEVPEVAFDAITLNRKTYDIEAKEIDDALARIAERSPDFEPAAEGVKTALGHVVMIDFKGSVDGVVFDGGTAEDFRLELGSGQFIDNFEDQLVGLKAGENTLVNVTFPDPYSSAELAGKKAQFEVTIREIQEKKTPEINEEFASKRGFADMGALRDAVEVQLKKEYDQAVRTQLKKQLFDVLEEQITIDLPDGMVEMEFKSIWERLKQAQSEGDESLAAKSDEELEKEYRAIARRRVKLGIVLAELGQKNNIAITRDEMNNAIMQQANMFPGQEMRVFEFYKQNPDRLDDLRGPILEEKAVDFVLSKVSYNDEKVTVADLIKGLEEEEEGDSTPAKAKTNQKSKKS